MARRLRIEFEGAVYHVINRGNYNGDGFVGDGGILFRCRWARPGACIFVRS
jgi:hypothetical protein